MQKHKIATTMKTFQLIKTEKLFDGCTCEVPILNWFNPMATGWSHSPAKKLAQWLTIQCMSPSFIGKQVKQTWVQIQVI